MVGGKSKQLERKKLPIDKVTLVFVIIMIINKDIHFKHMYNIVHTKVREAAPKAWYKRKESKKKLHKKR